jgi:hypothetical protein
MNDYFVWLILFRRSCCSRGLDLDSRRAGLPALLKVSKSAGICAEFDLNLSQVLEAICNFVLHLYERTRVAKSLQFEFGDQVMPWNGL